MVDHSKIQAAVIDMVERRLPAEKPAHMAPPQAPRRQHDADPSDVSADLNTILASTEKLLAINKGLAEPDERDSMEFRRFYTPDKLLQERIQMDAGKVRQTMMRRVSRARTLKPVGVSHMDPYAEGLIVGHMLSSPLEEINPASLIEQQRRISALGPGGIPSEDSITPEAQNVSPSQFGFIDCIAGPECHSADTEVCTSRGWVRWPDVRDDDEFACYAVDRMEFHCAERVIREQFSGNLIGTSTSGIGFLVTPNHRMADVRGDGSFDMQFACHQFTFNCQYLAEIGLVSVASHAWLSSHYQGMVYCATVPGGLLLTRRQAHSGFWSGNSSRIGVDVRAATGTRIGDDGKIYQRFKNRRTNRYHWMSPADVSGKVVAVPD